MTVKMCSKICTIFLEHMHRNEATYKVGLLEPRVTVTRHSYGVKKDHLTEIPHLFVHDPVIPTKRLPRFA